MKSGKKFRTFAIMIVAIVTLSCTNGAFAGDPVSGIFRGAGRAIGGATNTVCSVTGGTIAGAGRMISGSGATANGAVSGVGSIIATAGRVIAKVGSILHGAGSTAGNALDTVVPG